MHHGYDIGHRATRMLCSLMVRMRVELRQKEITIEKQMDKYILNIYNERYFRYRERALYVVHTPNLSHIDSTDG